MIPLPELSRRRRLLVLVICSSSLAAMGVIVFVLGLVTTTPWALGTAARTAAAFGTAEPTSPGPLRLLPGDLPQGR